MYFAFFCLEGSLHHHSAQLASSSEPYLHFQPYSPWGLFLTILCHIQNMKGTLNSVPKLHQYFLDHFLLRPFKATLKSATRGHLLTYGAEGPLPCTFPPVQIHFPPMQIHLQPRGKEAQLLTSTRSVSFN